MASLSPSPADDMNDEFNLDLHAKMLIFRNDLSRNEALWDNPEYQLRRKLMSLAHKLDLEYEYSLTTRVARISRPAPSDNEMDFETYNNDFLDLEHLLDDASFLDDSSSQLNSRLQNDSAAPLAVLHFNPDGSSKTPPTATTEACAMALNWPSPEFSSLPSPDMLNLEYTDFCNLVDVTSEVSQPLNVPIYEFSPEASFLWQQRPFNDPVSSAVKETENNCRLPSYLGTFISSLPSPLPSASGHTENPKSRVSANSYITPGSAKGPVPTSVTMEEPTYSTDTDHSDDRAVASKRERFHCTDYPPCKRSFVRSEHLARHIRKHTGRRPYKCHCGQKFSRWDNLRQHTQLVHPNGEIPAGKLANETKNSARTYYSALNTPFVDLSPARSITPPNVDTPADEVDTPNSVETSLSYLSTTVIKNGHRGGAFSRSTYSFEAELAYRLSNLVGLERISNTRSSNSKTRPGSGHFSRRSSLHSAAGSGYQEIIFDSRSGSQASGTSGASGRRRPLDSFAKAAMNAVKRVGACWRCKVLRKRCSAESPCGLCPEGGPWLKSTWGTVGCKRGDLKTQMVPVTLCWKRGIVFSDFAAFGNHRRLEFSSVANRCYHQNITIREREVNLLFETATNPQHEEPQMLPFRPHRSSPSLPLEFSRSVYSLLRAPQASLPAEAPLLECVRDIAWEFHDHSFTSTILGDKISDKLIDDFFTLLIHSARYQAYCENDRLIAQSLICLRSCLEALRVKELGHLGRTAHFACGREICEVQCLWNLELSLTLYLDELSRVIFKKENLRDLNGAYVSIFYSFCIQSFVRRYLQQLSEDGEAKSLHCAEYSVSVDAAIAASKGFLHLAVHLFIATWGAHDPLSIDYSIMDQENLSQYQKDLMSLQQALGGPTKSSSAYLKKIFEIEEEGTSDTRLVI